MSKPRFNRPVPIVGNDGDKIAFNDPEGRTSVTTTTGISAGAVHYIPLPVEDGHIHSVHIRYHDGVVATSAATLEVCNVEPQLISDYDQGADDWTVESNITVPTHAAGVGSDMIDISSIASRRARLALTVSGNGAISVWAWSK